MSPDELQLLADWLLDLAMIGPPQKLSDPEKALDLSRKIREQLPKGLI